MAKKTDQTITFVPISLIDPNPYQPASRLKFNAEIVGRMAVSIQEHGLLQVPVLRLKDGRYQVGDGWLRRETYRFLFETAPNKDQWLHLPAIVKELTDRQMADMVMEANTVRQDLSPIDLALFYKKYMEDFSVSEVEMAKAHNCSQGEVANTIRLLGLPDEIQQKIITQEITPAHGRCLLQLAHEENGRQMIIDLTGRIIKEEMRVAALDAEVKKMLAKVRPPLIPALPAVTKGPEVETKSPAAATNTGSSETNPPVIETKPVVTTTPPVTEMKPETGAAVVELATAAIEQLKTVTNNPRKLTLTESADGVMAGVMAGITRIGADLFMKKIPGNLETMNLNQFLSEAEEYWNKSKEGK